MLGTSGEGSKGNAFPGLPIFQMMLFDTSQKLPTQHFHVVSGVR